MKGMILSIGFGMSALAGLGFFSTEAAAHEPYYGGFRGGNYYGGGGHDVVPHWHRTYTPWGVHSWYGTGGHDYRPHHHRVTPWSYRSYSHTPWGYTESIHPRYPYHYAPW